MPRWKLPQRSGVCVISAHGFFETEMEDVLAEVKTALPAMSVFLEA